MVTPICPPSPSRSTPCPDKKCLASLSTKSALDIRLAFLMPCISPAWCLSSPMVSLDSCPTLSTVTSPWQEERPDLLRGELRMVESTTLTLAITPSGLVRQGKTRSHYKARPPIHSLCGHLRREGGVSCPASLSTLGVSITAALYTPSILLKTFCRSESSK